MPAFTVNRGYPYSLSTDPADIPGAIEALAEAIDLDAQARYNSVSPRPLAKISARSTTKQLFPASTETRCIFDFVDVDNAGISNISAFPTRLTPTSPGLWVFFFAIEVPALASTSREVFLRLNDVTDVTRYAVHLNPPTGSVVMMTGGAAAFMNGTTDFMTMTFNPISALAQYKIGNKQFGCFRVTNA